MINQKERKRLVKYKTVAAVQQLIRENKTVQWDDFHKMSELVEALFRIERTLHRWHELECGTDEGCISQDKTTGKWTLRREISGKQYTSPVANRERGALRRLVNLLEPFKNKVAAFIQSDPRGAALYLYDPRKFTTQHIDNNSANAICICNRF